MDHEEISKKLLTGDELILRGPSYAIYRPNNYCIFLGRLLKRERGYSHYQQVYSNYNNVFIFEYMPNENVLMNDFNKRIFIPIERDVCEPCEIHTCCFWMDEDIWGPTYSSK